MLARAAEVPGIRRVRFTTSHPRDFVRDIVDDPIDHAMVRCIQARNGESIPGNVDGPDMGE